MSRSQSEIRGRVHALVASVSPGGERSVHDGATLVGELGLESIEVLELVCKVEAEFGIEVEAPSDLPIETVGDLVDAVVAWVTLATVPAVTVPAATAPGSFSGGGHDSGAS
jgi:acyl carrier protein